MRYIAGATFTLYLFHYPVVHFLLAVLHWKIDGAGDMVLLSVMVLLIVFAIAEVTERRKKFFRELFSFVIRCYRQQEIQKGN